MNKPIKSYKAFDKNMRCRGFQYEVGKEYDMNGDIQCCKRGFHACESPMEVWDYYDMLTSRFAEVEQSGKISTGRHPTKICSSHIKIKAELKLADIINIGVEWLKNLTSPYKGDAEGNYAKIGSSGDYAQIGSSGNNVKIGSSGIEAKIGSSGIEAKIGSSGGYAQIGSSGDYAQIGSSGRYSQIGSSGDYAQIGSSGEMAQVSSSGFNAKIDSTGENSVIMCSGLGCVAKAKIGSWITLAEWERDDRKGCLVPVCVKTERVDGTKIKPDTWYKLRDGEFVEVTE